MTDGIPKCAGSLPAESAESEYDNMPTECSVAKAAWAKLPTTQQCLMDTMAKAFLAELHTTRKRLQCSWHVALLTNAMPQQRMLSKPVSVQRRKEARESGQRSLPSADLMKANNEACLPRTRDVASAMTWS